MGDFWKNKRVFVTGANGFLGSHLTAALIARGARPIALVYEENPGGLFDTQNLSEKTDIVRGDICDLPLLESVFKKYDVDVVFHLAAQAIVDQALDDPLETFEANIRGTWNLLEAHKRGGSSAKIIVASSDKAYGPHDELPYVEDVHPLQGGYPYEVSKSCADLISQSFNKAFETPVCITRCANLYGPCDLKFNRLIPNTIAKLHANKPPIIRDTGTSSRDYLYIDDAVEAYLLLAEKMDKKMFGEAFNFSTNIPLSVLDVITTISRAMGKNIEPTVVQTHGMEIRHQRASFDKARTRIGWEPRHTFVEGIKKTIPWYIAHLEHVK
jgi:CDP-glucose 4,6-dehydratase